jgi:hypothetical protein
VPLHKVIAAVAVTMNEDDSWSFWNTRGLAIYAATAGSAEGFAIFDAWSKKWRGYDAQATADRWASYESSPPTEIGVGSILKWATDACPKWELLAYERPDRTIADQMAEIGEIARLATLPYMLYEQVRDEAAERLHVRKSVLDEIVQKMRPRTSSDDELQGVQIEFTPPEPWPYAVDGAELINDMQANIRKHVILSEHQALAVCFWVMHAHAVNVFEHTPRLQFDSPTKRCGKTTALNTIMPMLSKPLSTENITMAALFRAIAMWQPTLLIDEADSFLKRENGTDNEDLRGILNRTRRRRDSHRRR